MTQNYQDSIEVNPITSLKGIFSFGEKDIWLTAGSVFHWNGVDSIAPISFSRPTLPNPNGTVYYLWGNSSDSLYGVGDAGTIVLFDGSSWKTIQSGTSLDFQDIWGSGDQILAVASNPFSP